MRAAYAADLASTSSVRAERLLSMPISGPALGNNCVKKLFGKRMRRFPARIDPLLHSTHVSWDDAKVPCRDVVAECTEFIERPFRSVVRGVMFIGVAGPDLKMRNRGVAMMSGCP